MRLAVPEGILPIVAAANPCYTTAPLPQDNEGRLSAAALPELLELVRNNSVAELGPGLGQSADVGGLLVAVLEQTTTPLVLDADALNVLVGRLDALRRHQGPIILTPHPGEFARLLGCDIPAVQARREELAVRFAATHGVVLVLKGQGTIVTDGRRMYINTTGNPGMATGGTGDVLGGLIAALVGQKLETFAAAQLGVYLHGLAGDLALGQVGEVSLIASDLLHFLPQAFRKHGAPSPRLMANGRRQPAGGCQTSRLTPAVRPNDSCQDRTFMNLLCPNCQKMLTVPEEFAGQLMKCPLCSGTFTVPGLPGTAAPPSPSMPEPDIFSVRHDPAPPAPPPPAPVPPVSNLEPLPPLSSATTTKPASSPAPSLSSLPPEGYRRTLTTWFSPRVLPWIAPVCLLLVFFLLFFNWVGVYPGGEPAVTQNAWQAAFGLDTVDGDLKKYATFLEDNKYKPGASVLTIFYLLLFFPVLAVTIASVIITMIHVKLPPGVEKLLPWRWGIVAAANLILFLFLGLQVLIGFSLDSRYGEWTDQQVKSDSKETKTTQQKKEGDAERGELLERLTHTIWLRLVIVLHLVAIVCAALMFWISQRGTHRPLPKLELMW